MSNDQRSNQSRGQQQQRPSGSGTGAAPPWNVYRLMETTKGNEPYTDFQPCGVAWPMKQKEGFNVDLHFALPEGTRIAIMPRAPKNEDR